MNKRIVLLVIIIVIGGVVVAFSLFNNNQEKELTSNNQTITNENTDTNTSNEGAKIKLSFNDNEVYVRLNNSKSSNDLLSMLPLTLEFEDFNDTEKIAYLPRSLTTEDAPSGYIPKVGDFSYYAPWGNLSIFYKDFRYSDSLVKLGEFESGIENLQNIRDSFSLTIERVE